MQPNDKSNEHKQHYEVGYKKPPKEHQFKAGQSGNPSGPPKRRVQLWNYICEYMGLTDTEIEKLDRTTLTQSQQTAIKVVLDAKKGEPGFLRLVQYMVDRDEGKAVQTSVIKNETDERQRVLDDRERKLARQISLAMHNPHLLSGNVPDVIDTPCPPKMLWTSLPC